MLKFYFEMLRPVVATVVACKELGIDEAPYSSELTELVIDLQLFAEQHHHTEMLNALLRRLCVVQLNETDYDTDLASISELRKVTVDDLDEQFISACTPWRELNKVSELMKFLTLRWVDRFNVVFVVRHRIWTLVAIAVRCYRQTGRQRYLQQLLTGWSKVTELLQTLDDVDDREALERIETTVRAIPEKVVFPIDDTPAQQ